MSNWIVCPTCRKHVRLKPWLGTLHFCLTEEECQRLPTQAEMNALAWRGQKPVAHPNTTGEEDDK